MKSIDLKFGIRAPYTDGGVPLADRVMAGNQLYLVTGAVFCGACSSLSPHNIYHLFAEFWDVSGDIPEPIGSFMVFDDDNSGRAGVLEKDVPHYAEGLIRVWEITMLRARPGQSAVQFIKEQYNTYSQWVSSRFAEGVDEVAQTLGIDPDDVYEMLGSEDGTDRLTELITQYLDRRRRAAVSSSFDVFSNVRLFSVN